MSSRTIDLVIIGAGCAGLTAAVQAAELGLSVCVIEKTGAVGGSAQGGNGLFAVGTKMQRDRQVSLTPEKAFRQLMEFSHWQVDARLVSVYVRRSAATFEWLCGLGIPFIDVVAYFPGAEQTWHFKIRPPSRLPQSF